MATDLIARGLAAKSFATVRANTIAVEEFGARTTGNSRTAVQQAIDLAAANGIPQVTCRLPRMELWEPQLDDPNGSDLAWLYRNRTLRIPACDNLDLDFGGASITLKSHTGVGPPTGQSAPNAFGGIYGGGFLSCTGIVQGRLRIANVTCDGGYVGDPLISENVSLFHKGLMCQDLGDASAGPGNGFGDLVMENVTLHSFGGEIMYDNSSRNHLSRDCHFHTSPQSAWNPSGIGKLVAYNLQAGNSSQPAEILGGKGHTYHGGRFYKAGNSGSAVIGGPDPTFVPGQPYNFPARRNDAPPPYIDFHGTRFEDYNNYLYLGSYVRGSIHTTDVAIFLSAGFASSNELKDIDLDVYATVDRRTQLSAVQFGGAASLDGSEPKNCSVRIHCKNTDLAATSGNVFTNGMRIGGFFDPSCWFKVDGIGTTAFGVDVVPGATLPLIDTTGFRKTGNPDVFGVTGDHTYTIASRSVVLYPTAAGTFNIGLNTAQGYTPDQLFTFYHDGSGAGDRIISFARNGPGMKLNAARTLRRAGDYLTLRRSVYGPGWVEAEYSGDVGAQTIPVLAAALIPNVTNGPAPGQSESATNKVMLATLDFDAATAEAAQIAIPMPLSWNEAAVSIQFVWTAGSGAGSSVVWGCQALALSDDDPLDAAFGPAQRVTDAVTAAGDVLESAFTAPVAVAGAPAAGDLVVFRVFRDAADAADTHGADARLIAVRIRYTADAENDA